MGVGAAIVGAIGIFGGSGTLLGSLVAIGIESAISLAANKILNKQRGAGDREGRTQNIRANNVPHHVVYGECRKGGLIFYLNGTGDDNEMLHMGLVVASHQCESIFGIHFNGELVPLDGTGNPTNRYKNYARILWTLGSNTQTAIAEMVAENDNWTVNHRARGQTYIYARLKYKAKIYPNFIPAITARVKGHNTIYDPRDGQTKWTNNPALCAADCMERYLNIPRSRIDTTHLVEAANICDQLVSKKDGSTEKRYTCGGFFELTGNPEDWLEPLINAMSGNVTEHSGIYYISAGHYKPPVITIEENDIISGIKYRTAESDNSRSNAAKGIFIGVDSFDQPTDFPAILDNNAIIEDGGIEKYLELDLEFTPSHTQAQRQASIALKSSREDERLEFSISLLKGLEIKPWDTVELDLESLALTGTWQVQTHIVNVEPDQMSVGVTLKRHTEEVYDWNPQTQEKPLEKPTTNLPGANALDTASLTYTLNSNASHPDHQPATIEYTWADPEGSFLAIQIEATLAYEYRVQGALNWITASIDALSSATPDQEQSAMDFGNPLLTDVNGYEFQNHQITTARIRTQITANTYTEWQIIV